MKSEIIKKTVSLFLAVQIAAAATIAGTASATANGISLNRHTAEISVGDSITLTAILSDNSRNIHFAATDDKLVLSDVKVDSNSSASVIATAVGNTNAKIIAFSSDGKYTDECTVSTGAELYESEKVNRAVGGTAEVDKTNSNAGEDITKAFDNTTSTKWLALNANSAEITYSFADNSRYFINEYALVSANDDSDRDPKSWILYGSNDGESWDTLDTRTDEIFYGRKLKRIFSFNAQCAYSKYKLSITENNGGVHTQLSEIQLFECGEKLSWGMGPFEKIDESNPILEANDDRFTCPVRGEEIYWTDLSLYNPTAIIKDGKINLLYRAQDNTDKKTSRIGLATSTDGLTFDRMKTPVLYPDNTYNDLEWGGGCEDPRVVGDSDGNYYLYYTGYNGNVAKLMVATSTDLVNWTKHGLAFGDAYGGKYSGTWSKSGSVVTEIVDGIQIAKKIDGKYWMYWGESDFFMATSDDLIHWTPIEDENGELLSVMKPRKGMYDSYLVEPGPAAIYTENGIFMLYNCANDNPDGNGDPMLANRAYCPGQVLFSGDDPTKLLNRSQSYFMYPEKDYELDGLVNNVCFVEGMVYYNDIWYIYYGTADSRLAVARWKPNVDIPPEKEVALDKNSLTMHAGKAAELSATGSKLKFISTDSAVTIGDAEFNAESGKTTITLDCERNTTATIIAYNETTFEYDICEVTVTKAFETEAPRFFSGENEITAITCGTISASIDVTGYYDADVSLVPIIAEYYDGVLIEWASGTPTNKLTESQTISLVTPSLNIAKRDDMTKYSLKAFLWDESRIPMSDSFACGSWSAPNLALGKNVTASSVDSDKLAAANIVDGNTETRWTSKYEDNQWITVDLGETMQINQVVLNWETAYSSSYRIDVSTNGTADTDFTAVYSNSNSNGGNDVCTFDTVSARYVRLYCIKRATGWGNSLWELEIYNSNQKNDEKIISAATPTTILGADSIHISTNPNAKTAEVVLTLPESSDIAASVICLTPEYLNVSGVKDASDYTKFKSCVCALDQYTFDKNGAQSFSIAVDEVMVGEYLLAITTDCGNYLYTFNFDNILPGDIDLDGDVSVSDVVALRRLILNGSHTETELKCGDLDADSKLTVSDVVALRKLIMK